MIRFSLTEASSFYSRIPKVSVFPGFPAYLPDRTVRPILFPHNIRTGLSLDGACLSSLSWKGIRQKTHTLSQPCSWLRFRCIPSDTKGNPRSYAVKALHSGFYSGSPAPRLQNPRHRLFSSPRPGLSELSLHDC